MGLKTNKTKQNSGLQLPGKSVIESKKSNSPAFSMNMCIGSEALYLFNRNMTFPGNREGSSAVKPFSSYAKPGASVE